MHYLEVCIGNFENKEDFEFSPGKHNQNYIMENLLEKMVTHFHKFLIQKIATEKWSPQDVNFFFGLHYLAAGTNKSENKAGFVLCRLKKIT